MTNNAECPQENKMRRPEKLTSMSDVASQRKWVGLTPETCQDNNCLRDVAEFRSSYGKCE